MVEKRGHDGLTQVERIARLTKPIEKTCANCADLRRQLAEVTAERDRLSALAWPDGPAGDAAMPCSRYRELEAERDGLEVDRNNLHDAISQFCELWRYYDSQTIKGLDELRAALRREE